MRVITPQPRRKYRSEVHLRCAKSTTQLDKRYSNPYTDTLTTFILRNGKENEFSFGGQTQTQRSKTERSEENM